MIQTYGKSGRPLDPDGEPDGDPIGGGDWGVAGPTVGGADGLREAGPGEATGLGPDPQPDTARATSHTNASGALRGPRAVMSPIRRLPLAAAPEQRAEDAPDDVLPQARACDLATGPDRRIDRPLTRPCVSFGLLCGGPSLALLFASRAFVGSLDLALLTSEL